LQHTAQTWSESREIQYFFFSLLFSKRGNTRFGFFNFFFSPFSVAQISVGALHGGKTQDQREYSIGEFKAGEFNVLVATDVAGRGIDIPDVGLVINFEMPNSIEQYKHRIGRTGRAGRSGLAISLLSSTDSNIFYDLKTLLQQSKQRVPSELAHVHSKAGKFRILV
jgi:superfamily II DNA/RNA helicase